MGKNTPRKRSKTVQITRGELVSSGELIRRFELDRPATKGRLYDAGPGYLARMVRPGWLSRPTGTLVSTKCEWPVFWESALEYTALLICEYDSQVIKLRTQPYRLEYETAERTVKTYPDIELELLSGRRKVVQVKPMRDLGDEEVSRRLDRDRKVFEAFDWDYEIWTEKTIMVEPRRSTLNLLHYYLWHPIDRKHQDAVVDLVKSGKKQTIGSLMASLELAGVKYATLLKLIAQKVLTIDLTRVLGPDMPVEAEA